MTIFVQLCTTIFGFRLVMNTQLANIDTRSAVITMTDSANIRSVVRAFTDDQDVAISSRNLYYRSVNEFFSWVVSSGRVISSLALSDLIVYKDSLLSSGKSSLTVASYINSIRRFYNWTESNKIYPDIGKGLHAPKRKQQFKKKPLTVDKVGDLLRHERDNQSARDFAIINLMIRTGLRTVEVVRADVGDITFIGDKRVLMVQGKGRTEKDNFVILTDDAFAPIREYLNTRPERKDSDPLFVSDSHRNGGGRLTTRTISGIAKAGLKAVGLDDKVFTAHSLRHTAGTNILRAGGSLEQAQYMLRHTNPATTQIYVATLREEQRLANGGELMIDNLYKGLL